MVLLGATVIRCISAPHAGHFMLALSVSTASFPSASDLKDSRRHRGTRLLCCGISIQPMTALGPVAAGQYAARRLGMCALPPIAAEEMLCPRADALRPKDAVCGTAS